MAAMLSSFSVFAFASVPKESARVLKVTRGKPFSSGAVFINGKYIEPPYVVERWGTGIRINGHPVTGQVVDWNEFVKTQSGSKAAKKETAVAPAPVEDVDANSLDELFEDDATSKKAVESRKPVVTPKPISSKQASGCLLEGEFVPNDATRKMVGRINALRTEIDRTLRTGGFICFGDAYSQVTGDSRTLMGLLETLPELQKNARDEQDFCEKVRGARLLYLNEVLRMDLYRNRVDYRKLQELRKKMKRDAELQKILDEASTPLL